MNFQVPQFIEIEDKIFGPLTFKQFVYVAGSIGIAFLFYASPLPFFIAIFPMIAVVGFGLALAFYKINNRPFINMAESAFRFAFTKKLYIWKLRPKKLVNQASIETTNQTGFILPKLSGSKLKDLSWSLDVNETLK